MLGEACRTRPPQRRRTGVPLLLGAVVLSLSFSFVAGLSGVGPRSLRSPQPIQGARRVCAKYRLVLRQRGGGEDNEVDALRGGESPPKRTVQFQVPEGVGCGVQSTGCRCTVHGVGRRV